MKRWDESYFPAAKRAKKESSWKKEEQHFRVWIKPLLGNLPLRSIELQQWDELVKSLAAGELSQRSKEYITGTRKSSSVPKNRGPMKAWNVTQEAVGVVNLLIVFSL